MKRVNYLLLFLLPSFSPIFAASPEPWEFDTSSKQISAETLHKWGHLSPNELLILSEEWRHSEKALDEKISAEEASIREYQSQLTTLEINLIGIEGELRKKENDNSFYHTMTTEYEKQVAEGTSLLSYYETLVPEWHQFLIEHPDQQEEAKAFLSLFPKFPKDQMAVVSTLYESPLPYQMGIALPPRDLLEKGVQHITAYNALTNALESIYENQSEAQASIDSWSQHIQKSITRSQNYLTPFTVELSAEEAVLQERKKEIEAQIATHKESEPTQLQHLREEHHALQNTMNELNLLFIRNMELSRLSTECRNYGVLTIKGDHERCAVCLDNFVDEVESHKVRVNPCKHMFHHDCIKSLVTCPSCRGPLPGNLTHIGKESTEQTPIFLLSGSHPTVPATTLEWKLSQLEASYQNQSSAVRTQISLLLKKYLDKKHTLLTCEATEAIQLQSPMAAMLQTMEDRPLDSLPGFYHDQQEAFIKTVSPEVQLQLPISLMIATGDALIDLHAEQSVFTKLRTQYLRLKTRLLEKIQDQ